MADDQGAAPTAPGTATPAATQAPAPKATTTTTAAPATTGKAATTTAPAPTTTGQSSPTGQASGAAPTSDTSGTLADAPGDDTAATTPANWPTNWREIMAGGDRKLLERLNRFNSPANLTKSWLAAQMKIGSGEYLRAKPDGTDDAALNEWRAQAGIPEKPEGYLEKLPKGLVIGEADKPMIDTFIKSMHDADAPPGYVHTALAWYYDAQEKIAAERAESDRANRARAEDDLRSEWGPEFRANLNSIHGLLDGFGSKEIKNKLFSARLADGTPLGDDPGILKMLAGLSRELNPRGVVAPAAGKTIPQTIEAEIASIEREMTTPSNPDPHSYHRNEAKQARYRELIELRSRYQARSG